ncbi:glycosyltransferase family 4 protein [Diaminobutyricimonas sp. TR449]|uniref:glycosyltransferase family 4 protein n=1 Tax=Diaminobutyricimonas sp. TR449 TaxID=2708076 RepID=UPI00141EEC7D|nr:glycosyltransferase family 4 protein [Diaminobutyricimonas sp. TR449]
MAVETNREELDRELTMTAALPRVNILFRSETDVDAWRTAHARRERPDATPYGLHRIGEHGFDVSWESAAPASRLQKLSLLAPMRPTGASSTNGAGLAVTWDEHTAMRMQVAKRGGLQATGVIWATDTLSAASVRAPIELAVLRRVLRRMTLLWCLSRAQLGPLSRWLGPGHPPIEFIRFGIDEDFFRPAAKPGQRTILSLGNDQDRDPRCLLDAFSIVRARLGDVELRLQTKEDLPLPEGATRLPHLPHAALTAEYARAHVVTVATKPNLHVSGMTTVLEAMASARPVVLSDTPGTSDYVADDRWGYRAVPSDPQSLAQAMIRALDADTGARLGAAGRQAVEERFTSRHMVAALSAALHKAAALAQSGSRLRRYATPAE